MLFNLFLGIQKTIRNSILVLSVVCFAIPSAYAIADLALLPASGTFEAGQTFTVSVNVTNNNQPINAVSGAITFPTNLLSVRSVSKDGSIIKLWAEEPSFSNTNGTIKFEGVVLNPGFSGSKGKVLTVVFLAKSSGDASVIFSSGSVLANDGEATNVLQNMGNALYTVSFSENTVEPVEQAQVVQLPSTSPEVVSSSYPDSNAWYKSRDASFSWKLPKNVLAVRTLYGLREDSIPTRVYDPPIDNRSFKVDGDGVQYMHVQFKDQNGWGKITSYKFQIDTKSPESLRVTFPDGPITVNPKPSISVDAVDALSGIGSILTVIDSQGTTTHEVADTNLYQLPESGPGKHTVTVYAVDRAGNTSHVSLEYTVVEITPPTITEYTKNGEVGDVLKVSGVTYPTSVVEIVYTSQDGTLHTETTTSNQEGKFTALWSKRLSADVYELKARVIDSRGATSSYTQPKIVVIKHQSYIEIGMFVVNWLSLILIIIIAITCVVATLWYSFVQFNRFRRNVHRRLAEAENTLKTNVAALRRDTEEFHSILVKAEKKRPLTKEEQSILKKFRKRLEITEQEIEKKLEQIG
ncbi:MAG: hypothetical protein QG653_396 [Patescibacteria group bacterium]|nr:hypothetical protein [Patescibacteria group bacterium]